MPWRGIRGKHCRNGCEHTDLDVVALVVGNAGVSCSYDVVSPRHVSLLEGPCEPKSMPMAPSYTSSAIFGFLDG